MLSPLLRQNLLLWALLLYLPLATAAPPNMDAYVQRHEQGWIDWQNGLIYGVGKAPLKRNKGSKLRAKKAAQAMARANIIKLARQIQIDSENSIKTYDGGRLNRVIKAFIQDSEHSSRFVKSAQEPYYEVTQVAPIKGVNGLTSKLLSQIDSTQWPEIKETTAPVAEVEQDEDQPWLVLDASHLKLANQINPALLPTILSNSGETLYQPTSVNSQALRQRGMAEYVVLDGPAGQLQASTNLPRELMELILEIVAGPEAHAKEKRKRRKRKKFVVAKVEDTQGLAKTNLVVSNQDAQNLKKSDDSSGVLEKCRVVVVVSSKYGGIEGHLDNQHRFALHTR